MYIYLKYTYVYSFIKKQLCTYKKQTVLFWLPEKPGILVYSPVTS